MTPKRIGPVRRSLDSGKRLRHAQVSRTVSSLAVTEYCESRRYGVGKEGRVAPRRNSYYCVRRTDIYFHCPARGPPAISPRLRPDPPDVDPLRLRFDDSYRDYSISAIHWNQSDPST